MNVHATLRKRLRYAVDLDPRSSKTIAMRAGYSEGYLSGLINGHNNGNPTIGAVWALAGELGVDPLWLLGSDQHAAPERRPYEGHIAPRKLSPEVWQLVDQLRANGVNWHDVCRRLKADLGLVVHHSSLRRAWREKEACKD